MKKCSHTAGCTLRSFPITYPLLPRFSSVPKKIQKKLLAEAGNFKATIDTFFYELFYQPESIPASAYQEEGGGYFKKAIIIEPNLTITLKERTTVQTPPPIQPQPTTTPPLPAPPPRIVTAPAPQTPTPTTERIIETIRVESGLTQQSLTHQLQTLENKLRQEIANQPKTTTIVHQSAPSNPPSPSSGQATPQSNFNAIALTQKIDQLSGVTIINSTIEGGISGLTDNDIPNDITASNYLLLSGGTLSGYLSIGTSTRSEPLTINGAIHLGATTTPATTNERLYNESGTLYWSGNVIGGATVGTWDTDGSHVYRASGNVGIGTTSPYAKLTVSGQTVAEYFTATSTTATSTFAGGLNVLAINQTGSATSTFANGIDLANGCLALNGACVGTTLSGFTSDQFLRSDTSDSFTSGTLTFAAGTVLNLSNTGANMLLTTDASGNVVASSTPVVAAINATSTTATSTFAGGLSVAGSAGLTVLQSGNVGIGTASPRATLHVAPFGTPGTPTLGAQTVAAFQRSSSPGTTATISVISGNTGLAELVFGDTDNQYAGIVRYDNSGDSMGFFTAGTEKMRITSTANSGNVGIGTTTPFAKLSVTGNILADNVFTRSDNFATVLGDSAGDALHADGLGNTALGYQTLQIATSSDYNVAIGYQAGQNLGDTSNYNVGIGYQVLDAISAGADYNVGIGRQALSGNTTGDRNVGIGDLALSQNTTGMNNVAVGGRAMQVNTTGTNNVGLGDLALTNNTTGGSNVGIGNQALSSVTTAGSNIGIGGFALLSNTAANNTVIGVNALRTSVTGSANAILGYHAGFHNTSATNTTVIGYRAGFGVAGASNQHNVFVGFQSGLGISSGSNNLLLGYQSGDALTTGSNNIAIGYDIDLPSNTASNQLTIGNLIFGTGIDGTGTTLSSGNIGIASSTPWRKLSVTGTVGLSSSLTAESGSDEYLCIDPTTYEVTQGGVDCGASSLRYKEDIEGLTYGLDTILALNPVFYRWSKEERPNDRNKYLGFIAEEMNLTIPEVVSKNKDGEPESIDYNKLTAVIVKGMQDLHEMVKRSTTILGDLVEATVGRFSSLFAQTGTFNAIQSDTATHQELQAGTISGDQICIGTICVTEEQFRQVFSEEVPPPQKQGTETPAQEKTPNQPPTIHLNGNNPAKLHVGDSYNDLGITIKDDHDHNLGYTTLVNGAPTTNNRIKIDTNEPGEHEITYTVTDNNGERTTATRSVIIEPLTHTTAENPEPPEEETPPESESPTLPTPEQPAPIIEPEPQETPQPKATSTNNNEAPQDLTSSTSPAQP